jgi:hypothetical protein
MLLLLVLLCMVSIGTEIRNSEIYVTQDKRPGAGSCEHSNKVSDFVKY